MPLNPWLIAGYAVTVLVELLAPFVLALFLARRFRASWRFWLLGVLVFLVSQVLTRIPAVLFFQSLPAVRQVLQVPLWSWLFIALLAVTAGLFEEGGRWLAFRWLVPPAERRWRTALMLGAGHGGLESIGIGLIVLAALANYLALALVPVESLGVPAEQIASARAAFASMQGWEPLVGAYERVMTLVVHVGLTVLVLQAFLRGRRWWWFALAGHALLDFAVVAVNRLGRSAWGPEAGLLLAEGVGTIFAVLAVCLIVALRPRGDDEAAPPELPPAGDFALSATPAVPVRTVTGPDH